MTLTQLRNACPAAFATEPHEDVSKRYVFVPSTNIIEACYARGFEAVKTYSRPRSANVATTSHMIRFRQPAAAPLVGAVFPELVMFNSHDRSRRFSLSAGVFRLVCSNGLTVGMSGKTEGFDFIHLDVDPHVEIDRVLNSFEKITDDVVRMQHRPMEDDEEYLFAKRALLIQHDNHELFVGQQPIKNWLNRRRDVDLSHDLWTVFNVVQENIMAGGVETAGGRTREMREPRMVAKVNEGLWNLAMEFANN